MAQQQALGIQLSDHDLEIYENVVAAIEDDTVVRESRVPIEVHVENGVVTLSGLVLSEVMRQRVLYAAATTPGVKKVIDHLYSDRQIEQDIARVLANDPLLRGTRVEINSYQGTVTLYGVLESAEQKEAALKLAGGVPGVRRLHDLLEVNAKEE